MSNNAAERELRAAAVGRCNWTFVGSDEGGRRAAALYTLIATAKLNDIDPQAWLADMLAHLPDHSAKRIHELLPRHWRFRSIPTQARLNCNPLIKQAIPRPSADAYDAVLGTSANVPTLDGQITVTVPAGTQPDSTLRLRGKGLPRFGGGSRGDLYIRLQVHVPERLSDRQRRLFGQLRASKAAK